MNRMSVNIIVHVFIIIAFEATENVVPWVHVELTYG